MRSIPWILGAAAFAGVLFPSVRSAADGQDAESRRSKRFEQRRVACLESRGLLAYKRGASVDEFVPKSAVGRPDSWGQIIFHPGIPPGGLFRIGMVPSDGLRRVFVEQPLALGTRETAWTHLKYDHFALTYDARPFGVRESALFELRVLAREQEISEDLRLRVRDRIEQQKDLDLMRASLALCTSDETQKEASLDDAVYRYVLTKGQHRRTDGNVVRELSAGQRVALCFGLDEILESQMITVMVYDDSRRVYDVFLWPKRERPTEGPKPQQTGKPEELIHVLRSVVECALNPEVTEGNGR